MDTIALPASEKARLHDALVQLNSPYDDLDEFLLFIYPVFAGLPRDLLRRLFLFRDDPEEYGALLLENFPIDDELPPTPSDGRPAKNKKSFVSEACILGIAQILGQPFGYRDEKEGEVIHALCPVRREACATSSESSQVDLGFHTDFNFDKDNPELPYNVGNPDFVTLICIRSDRKGEACTLYADARDIYQRLTVAERSTLRMPLFQFAASYSFTGKCGAERIWSVPSPVIKGPDKYPEVSIDLLCGIRALDSEAEAVLDKVRELCKSSHLASRIYLKPGDILLMDNRKGAHARTAFAANFDGYDRWLERVYVRRSLWEIRKQSNKALRVF